MSEAMTIPPLDEAPEKRVPTVYFIDDSATMREVIKIAFRREHIHVITCADAASALAQFQQTRPDVVITDVIMPDQDGYSVCTQIKENPDLSGTPVLLMSGVVNKTVADKAVSVRADELIRKPFQPQELINRVKALLEPQSPGPTPSAERSASAAALSSLFAPALPAPQALTPSPAPPAAQEPAWPRALAEAFAPRPPAQAQAEVQSHTQTSARPAASAHDLQKLRMEIARLELLVKKLQTELQIERQYNQALETQIRAFAQIE